MHGTISLQSKLDHGTIATFTVPFNKPQFQGAATPLVDIGPLPDRFQSELSLSCNNSSGGSNAMPGRGTPPLQSPALGEFSNGDASIHKKAPDNVNPPQAALTEVQKRDFHILVVEDNAINQQIALKTIRNLGFSVSAVWNGKEALDYLLKATETAQSPNPANSLTPGTTPANSTPLPNVILMDVQMPILDGYRATHTLRYHAPFRNIQAIQKIPIVAMTASAIQGDREKCKRAGMDDYISKPTPRNKLEKIILKWAEGAASMIQKTQNNNSPEIAHCGTGHSSDCPGSDYPSLAEQEKSSHSPALSISPTHSHGRCAQHHQNHLRPHLNPTISEEKIKSLRKAGDPPTSLSEADRGLRRVEAEEQAANLRDEKLLAATEMRPYSPLDGGAGAGNMSGGLGSCSPLLVGSASAGLPFSSGSPLGGAGGVGGGSAAGGCWWWGWGRRDVFGSKSSHERGDSHGVDGGERREVQC